MQPEIPVDKYVSEEVYPMHPIESRDIVQARYNEPYWINTLQAPHIERYPVFEEGSINTSLCPREPQTYTTKKQEHIHTEVTHSAQTIEIAPPWQPNVEENDEKHRHSHVLRSESGDIYEIYVLYLHEIIRIT